MTSLDPVRPYVDLIRLALWIVLALSLIGAGFYGGLRWSADDLEDERERVTDLNRALAEFVDVFDAVNAQHARDRAAADRQAERAHEAAARAERRAEDYRAALDQVGADIADAKRDPDCRAILEQTTCAVLR